MRVFETIYGFGELWEALGGSGRGLGGYQKKKNIYIYKKKYVYLNKNISEIEVKTI